jgi:polysaccharide export outer membrane protein
MPLLEIEKQLLLFEKHPQVLKCDIDLTDINVMKSPYFYLQPNDYIYVKPLKLGVQVKQV